MELLGVHPVAHDVNRVRVQLGIGTQDVLAHAVRHGDDRVGSLIGAALGPRRQPVPATQLLGLPRTERFEGVGAHHVGHVTVDSGEHTGQVGVPRVGVHEIDVLVDGSHHGQICAEHP